jgi:hypothetical protein
VKVIIDLLTVLGTLVSELAMFEVPLQAEGVKLTIVRITLILIKQFGRKKKQRETKKHKQPEVEGWQGARAEEGEGPPA